MLYYSSIQIWFAKNLNPEGNQQITSSIVSESSSLSEEHSLMNTKNITAFQCPSLDNFDNESKFVATNASMYITGLVMDASKLRSSIESQLLELSCIHKVGIHILTDDKAVKSTNERFSKLRNLCFGQRPPSHQDQQEEEASCAPMFVDADPIDAKSLYPNRVNRIAHLRDHQREKLRSLLLESSPSSLPDAIIVADLDLYTIPSNVQLLEQVGHIVHGKRRHDVICSGGLTHHPFGYYDTFATVLKSGTFVYPIGERLSKTAVDNEEQNLIQSDQFYGKVTQQGLLDYFRQTGQETSKEGTVEVQSCFGGLAIYRADTWFQEECTYSMEYSSNLTRYANMPDGRPCEHVVFHQCLRTLDPSIRITIQPFMNPWWDEPKESSSYVLAGGKLAKGIQDNHGLVTPAKYPEYGLQLQNGNFTLRIDKEMRALVVEERISSSNTRIRWTSPPYNEKVPDDLEYLFLTLSHRGELILIQQLSSECSRPPCRKVIWSSEDADSGVYVLYLGQDGVLSVADVKKGSIIWQNEDQKITTTDAQEIIHIISTLLQ